MGVRQETGPAPSCQATNHELLPVLIWMWLQHPINVEKGCQEEADNQRVACPAWWVLTANVVTLIALQLCNFCGNRKWNHHTAEDALQLCNQKCLPRGLMTGWGGVSPPSLPGVRRLLAGIVHQQPGSWVGEGVLHWNFPALARTTHGPCQQPSPWSLPCWMVIACGGFPSHSLRKGSHHAWSLLNPSSLEIMCGGFSSMAIGREAAVCSPCHQPSPLKLPDYMCGSSLSLSFPSRWTLPAGGSRGTGGAGAG